MNREKLLVITTSYPIIKSSVSGVFVKRLNDALNQYFDIQVICPAGTTPKTAEPSVIQARYAPWDFQRLAHQAGGIPVALRNNRWLVILIPIMLISMFFTMLFNIGKNEKILAHWALNGVIAGVCNLFFKRPLITVFHGTDANSIQSSFINKWTAYLAIRLSDQVIGVSESITQALKEKFPCYEDKIYFISNGIEDTLLNIPSEEVKPFTFTTIANLNPLKGVGDVITAFSKMNNKNAKLKVVGSGSEKNNLENLAHKLGVLERVRFVGLVPPDDIPKILESTSVFVLASYAEGRPSVILEAMAAGNSVIASSLPGILEIIEHNNTGLVFEPGDTKQLSSYMDHLADDINLTNQLGRNAKSYVKGKSLTWSTTAQQYRDHFLEISKIS